MACLEDRLKACEEKIADLMGKEKTMVAFSAAAEYGGAYGPFDGDTTLVYNALIANTGDAYSASTGVFTAPVEGVYCFIFSYHAGGHKFAHLALLKNGEAVIRTSDHASADTADNGGNAAVLELKTGDQVNVLLAAGSHVWASSHHTTFSGFLIHQM